LKRVRQYRYALVNDVLDQAVTEMKAIVLFERHDPEAAESVAASCRTDDASMKLQAALGTFQTA
jgi:guanylate kinase